MDISLLHDNSLIICENNYKDSILENLTLNNLFLDVKFMTKKDFLSKYFFTYKEDTLYYLTNKYHQKIDIVKTYLNNLYYIDENKDYQNNKLKKLVSIKKELKENNLLVYDESFKKNINQKEIFILGYPFLENYEIAIFNNLNAKIVNEENSFNHQSVFEFDTMEDEVVFIANKICELIINSIDINKIKLTNVSEDYYNTITRVFNLFNIPIKIPFKNSLYSLEPTKVFLENYNSDINITINKIKKYDSKIVNKIINICNKYVFIDDYLKVKDLIVFDLKNASINNYNLEKYIEIKDLNSSFLDNEYVFIMNYNMGQIPKYIKDEDYITDNIKGEVGLKSTFEINKEIKMFTINKIKSISNAIITYKLKSNKNEFYPSSLIEDMHLTEEKINPSIFQSYSQKLTKLEYAKKLDLLNKYGSYTDELAVYYNTFKEINYNSYDNTFKNIDIDLLKNVLKHKLTLSYSSLDIYNKCAFRYYIKNVLKLDKYEESFDAFIGSVFHAILEKCLNSNLNVEEEIEKYIEQRGKTLSVKERFFINKIVEDIKFVINILKKQNEHINFDSALYEKNITINKGNAFPIYFVGFIDKILYKKIKDKALVTIVDYKTGFVDIDLKYVPYGLSMQLPIYLYLVKKANIFSHPIFTGFYIQYILDKKIIKDNHKTYLEQKEDNLKLMGYSINDQDILEQFDDTYQNSQIVKGLKVKSDGNFSAYSKVLTEEQMNNLINLTEEKIDNAINEILKGNFAINPKKIGYDQDYGCKYCKFKDICYKTEKDYVIYEEIKTLDFLGGDENA